MNHPIAPGKDVYNVLSKRFLYRTVILMGKIRGVQKLKGPLVLEAKDRSYKYSYELNEGIEDGNHLVFDFYLKDRDKEYQCYLAGESTRFRWTAIPVELAGLDQLVQEAKKNG
jgi:hypothetical protein